MTNKMAEIIKTHTEFSGGAVRVCKSGAKFGEWNMYRESFEISKKPDSAQLLLLGADYFGVYLNGVLCAEYTVRSYIYDRAYEVFDVTDYISEGKNVIAVISCETGDDKRRGFSCELKTRSDGKEEIINGEWKTRKCGSIIAPMTYGLERSNVEIYDAREELDGWNGICFDDSGWESAEIIGAFDSEPFNKIKQSVQDAQSRYLCNAEKLITAERAGKYPGYDFCLSPSGEFCSAYMSEITTEKDITFKIIPTDAVSGISVDGIMRDAGADITVSAGKHTVAIAAYYGGPASFQIRTEARLEFSSPLGDKWLFYHTERPKIPFRYPWNEPKQTNPVPEKLSEFMNSVSFDALPDIIKTDCVTALAGKPGLRHDVMTKKYISAPDGFCEKAIEAATPRDKGDVPLGIEIRGNSVTVPRSSGEISLIYDFGREHIGLLSFEVDARAGDEISFFCFEMITESGIRYMGKNSIGKYICREGKQIFTSNRRRGFRYACLIINSGEGDLKINGISVIETRDPAEPAEAFRCNESSLNSIYDISVDTAKVCMMDSYVDCPGCEQNTWTGDAGITALINMVNFGKKEFDSRYLDMIGRSMDDGMRKIYRRGNPRYEAGNYLPCACFTTYPEGGIPIWSLTWVLQVFEHYRCFGADDNFGKNLDDVEECLRRCAALTNSRGLLEIDGAWNLIEWADNDLGPYGEVTANNMMLSECFSQAAEVFSQFGRHEKAAEYKKSASDYKTAVNKYCWNENKKAYIDTVRDEYSYDSYVRFSKEKNREILPYEQYLSLSRVSVQTNTLALLYGCADGERAGYCEKILLGGIKDGNYTAGTPANIVPDENAGIVGIGSPFFLYYAIKTLYKLGYDDIALNVIRRDWGKMTDDGFTTCVENFRGKDGEWGRSVAHAWSASPAIFLMTDVLGIKPAKPGYTEFTVVPKPSGLARASGAVPTPYGNIYVKWEMKDGKPEIFCRAPEKCKRI